MIYVNYTTYKVLSANIPKQLHKYLIFMSVKTQCASQKVSLPLKRAFIAVRSENRTKHGYTEWAAFLALQHVVQTLGGSNCYPLKGLPPTERWMTKRSDSWDTNTRYKANRVWKHSINCTLSVKVLYCFSPHESHLCVRVFAHASSPTSTILP